MAFVEQAESLRAKAHLSGAKLPVAIGLGVAAITVALVMGIGAVRTVADEALIVEQAVAAQEGDAESETAQSASKEGASSVDEGVAIAQSDEQAAATESTPQAEQAAAQTAPLLVMVHVGGAVNNPGVCQVASDARVADAIEAAGGFREDAAEDALNLARMVADGERIIVPTTEEYAASGAQAWQEPSETPATAASETSGASIPADSGSASGGLININTASAAELETLSGVGPSTAEKIIADREANGPFATCEDLMRVSGIGEKKFAAIADAICVG